MQQVSQQTLWTTAAGGSHDWLGRAILAETNNGRWMTAYYSGSEHGPVGGAQINLRFSDNEGTTWSDENKLPDGTDVTGAPFVAQGDGKMLTECVLIKCPNGDLLLHSYEYEGGGTSQWRSEDGGAMWVYEGIISEDTTLVAMDDAKVVGSAIYLVARVDPGSDFDHPHYLAFYRSDDNGVTWAKVADIEAALDCNEAGLLHVGGNVFHVYVKATNHSQTYRYISDDLGETWGERETVTYQVGKMNKPKCKTLGGYHWLYGRDVDSTYKTVIYPSPVTLAPDVNWYPQFFPDDDPYEDTGYCDILRRANGDYYMLSYAGTTAAASIIEYVFRVVPQSLGS